MFKSAFKDDIVDIIEEGVFEVGNKYVVCGSNSLGIYAHMELKRIHYEVIMADRKPRCDDTSELFTIITYKELASLLKNETANVMFLIAARGAKNIYEIWEQLRALHCYNVGIIKPRAQRFQLAINPEEDEVSGEIVWCTKNGEECAVIPRLEINLIDNCNLNCKACTHFSSIFKKGSYYHLDEYITDLKKLRRLGRFVRLRLLGGEPLLLSNLDEYISVTRNLFPESDIEVVTNGLLIPRLDPKILEVLRKERVSLVISLYKPTLNMKNQIEKVLNAYHVMWCMDGDLIEKFSRSLTLNATHDGYETSNICLQSGCTFFRAGKIYKCPFEGLFNELCDYYGLHEYEKNHGIDVEGDPKEVYEQIRRLVLEPAEMCKYCSEELEMISWSTKNRPELKDWLYKEGE